MNDAERIADLERQLAEAWSERDGLIMTLEANREHARRHAEVCAASGRGLAEAERQLVEAREEASYQGQRAADAERALTDSDRRWHEAEGRAVVAERQLQEARARIGILERQIVRFQDERSLYDLDGRRAARWKALARRLRQKRTAAETRIGELHQAMVRLTHETPYPEEGEENRRRVGVLTAEIGTLRAKLKEADAWSANARAVMEGAVELLEEHDTKTNYTCLVCFPQTTDMLKGVLAGQGGADLLGYLRSLAQSRESHRANTKAARAERDAALKRAEEAEADCKKRIDALAQWWRERCLEERERLGIALRMRFEARDEHDAAQAEIRRLSEVLEWIAASEETNHDEIVSVVRLRLRLSPAALSSPESPPPGVLDVGPIPGASLVGPETLPVTVPAPAEAAQGDTRVQLDLKGTSASVHRRRDGDASEPGPVPPLAAFIGPPAPDPRKCQATEERGYGVCPFHGVTHRSTPAAPTGKPAEAGPCKECDCGEGSYPRGEDPRRWCTCDCHPAAPTGEGPRPWVCARCGYSDEAHGGALHPHCGDFEPAAPTGARPTEPCSNWQLAEPGRSVWLYMPNDEDCGVCFMCRRQSRGGARPKGDEP